MDYSFKKFQKNAIIRFLALDKYNYIKENIYKCDVSNDIDFQTKFNSFYHVRRNKKWRNVFFNYFEKVKLNKNITFEEILKYMYENTEDHNIEASFCSKMLSTINPNMPIWDQFVLDNLKLKVDGKTKEDRLKNTIETYYKILKIEQEKLKDKNIQNSIKEFREYFPEYNLSDIKMLDYILWNTRDNDFKKGDNNE